MARNSNAGKLTPKQEKFCLGVLSGLSYTDAYKEAYDCSKSKDSSIHVRASELMRHPTVKALLSELKYKAAQEAEITALDLIAELEEARMVASRQPSGASAMVSAIMGKAKLLGIGSENVNTTVNGGIKTELIKFVD